MRTGQTINRTGLRGGAIARGGPARGGGADNR
jgi:hypothetical protein